MATGRYFRALTPYDLLGNLLPGVFALTVFVALLPGSPFPTSTGGVLFFALLSYTLGHFLQSHASKAMGDCFESTLDSVREYPLRGDTAVTTQEDVPSPNTELTLLDRFAIRVSQLDRDTINSCINYMCGSLKSAFTHSKVGVMFPPIYQPVLCWARNPKGVVLDKEKTAFEAFKDLVTRYDIGRGTEDYQRIMNLMSGEIDDISAPARSIRFQAIRNFHRAMWITSWYCLILTVTLVALENRPSFRVLLTTVGVEYRTPGLFSYWGPDWHFIVVFAVLTVGFNRLANEFEIQFTEYLFSDYQVSRESEREEQGWKSNKSDEE